MKRSTLFDLLRVLTDRGLKRALIRRQREREANA